MLIGLADFPAENLSLGAPSRPSSTSARRPTTVDPPRRGAKDPLHTSLFFPGGKKGVPEYPKKIGQPEAPPFFFFLGGGKEEEDKEKNHGSCFSNSGKIWVFRNKQPPGRQLGLSFFVGIWCVLVDSTGCWLVHCHQFHPSAHNLPTPNLDNRDSSVSRTCVDSLPLHINN